MMEKEFVSYEQAVALRELGFDEMCFGFYSSPVLELMHCKNFEPWMGNGVVTAPLKQQVFRWFREKYNLSCYIAEHLHFVEDYTKWKCVIYYIYYPELIFDTYEEAENACIDKLIELSKQLNKQ
jgi:hypothetical protein